MTGGAGYIGSHTVRLLLARGYDVAVVDDLSKGHRHNVPPERLYELNIRNGSALSELMRQMRFDAVVHFAAFIAVGESMREPARYFGNNVGGSMELLAAMTEAGVRRMVFSSTAAVYGTPHASPIREDFPIQPMSPYGESKVMVERLLRWFDEIHGLTSVCLRYFNASGADPEGQLGEEHDPETHLIPLVFRAIADGRADHGIRGRLRHRGRHVHSRLHPCERPGASSHSGSWSACSTAAPRTTSTWARGRDTRFWK